MSKTARNSVAMLSLRTSSSLSQLCSVIGSFLSATTRRVPLNAEAGAAASGSVEYERSHATKGYTATEARDHRA